MKLENYERIGTLRDKLIDSDEQLAKLAAMIEPHMAREWHKGLLKADISHPTDYRAGRVCIEIPTDYVEGALNIRRNLILSELRELGVEVSDDERSSPEPTTE